MNKTISQNLIACLLIPLSAKADRVELNVLEGEYWWGGLSAVGYEMPYDASTKIAYDMWGDNKGNQAQPLLISPK